MNQAEALKRIRDLGVTAFETRDISALLRVSPANASVLLSRLASRGHVARVGRGRWSIGSMPKELLVEHVSAPAPAYVSLQSALFRHGLIDQIPSVVYGVTLGRARRITTAAATISLHRMPPALFGGFSVANDGSKMATPEKALFDLCYLAPTRSRMFTSLPEIEIPRGFAWGEVNRWCGMISGSSRRVFVENMLASFRVQQRSRLEKAKLIGSG